MLDNVKFGFDVESKEFFVRISKEGVDYQFPTDQIMRLKAHLQETLDEQLSKNSSTSSSDTSIQRLAEVITPLTSITTSSIILNLSKQWTPTDNFQIRLETVDWSKQLS